MRRGAQEQVPQNGDIRSWETKGQGSDWVQPLPALCLPEMLAFQEGGVRTFPIGGHMSQQTGNAGEQEEGSWGGEGRRDGGRDGMAKMEDG